MENEVNINELRDILLDAPNETYNDIIEYIHPADILDVLHNSEKEDRLRILQRLPEEIIADIIEEEDDEDKYSLLQEFSDNKQIEILEEMSSDELTDLIGNIEDDVEVNEILQKISDENRADVEHLLSYGPETAGGIMATEFISIYDTKTVIKTLEYLQKEAPDVETAYYLYVTDKQGYLKGVVGLRDIVTASFDTHIADITNPNVISVYFDVDQEEVARKFEKYGFLMMPVIDYNNKMLGIITIDDVMEIIKDETTEDIHHLGGISEEEKVDGTLLESAKSRLPWLLVNLITACMAAFVVSCFEGTISKVVALATIMPIVTGMGGNAGTQSLTIIVRGIAIGALDKENAKRVFLKELGVGAVSGVSIGLLVAVLGMIFGGNYMFGVVTGVAMLLNMIVATIFGYLVPVILNKLNIDPALASGVFVTTATDMLGFFFFLGLATVFIQYLI